MKARRVLILGMTLLFGSVAIAQDSHKIEGTVDYSYVHANPQYRWDHRSTSRYRV